MSCLHLQLQMSSSCIMIQEDFQWPHRSKLCIIYSPVELFQTPYMTNIYMLELRTLCMKMNSGNKWVCASELTETHSNVWSHAFLFMDTDFQNSSVRTHTLNKTQYESKGQNNASAQCSFDLTHVTHNFQQGKEFSLFSKRFCLSGPLSLLFDGYIDLFPGNKVAQPWIWPHISIMY